MSLAQARFRLADAVAKHAQAHQALIALAGSDREQWPALSFAMPAPDDKRETIEATVRQLPQMQAALARVQAAKGEVAVRRGQTAANPTLSFRAGKEERDALLGVSLSIPLQVRNNFRAEVDAASAGVIEAEKASLDTFRKLKSRLQMARVSYRLSREAWQTWLQYGAGTLKDQVELLERLWEAGELSTTNYLIQLNEALQTRASAIEQRGRMWSDWSEWLLASGRISHWLEKTRETTNE